jgi:predicted 3-demethylubiquinone-9 3-methyltransferase (glyoxalase superfamily)
LERVFAILSEGGEVLMPLDNYGFSQKFGWVNDRFGVSWQLNLAAQQVNAADAVPATLISTVRPTSEHTM